MTKPARIQRKRTKGWKMPENTVYVGRPTKWGNLNKVGSIDEVTGLPFTTASATHLFRLMWSQTAFSDLLGPWVLELRGKNLACWCPLDQPCHADILLELANREPSAP